MSLKSYSASNLLCILTGTENDNIWIQRGLKRLLSTWRWLISSNSQPHQLARGGITLQTQGALRSGHRPRYWTSIEPWGTSSQLWLFLLLILSGASVLSVASMLILPLLTTFSLSHFIMKPLNPRGLRTLQDLDPAASPTSLPPSLSWWAGSSQLCSSQGVSLSGMNFALL